MTADLYICALLVCLVIGLAVGAAHSGGLSKEAVLVAAHKK